VAFSSTRITPDNDGNEDFLIIDLKLKGNGNVVSVTVFDEFGGFVKKLTDNMLAGAEASIIWNGTADDEKLVNSGIYILLISAFDDTGKTHKWKKVCTVIR
jgi:flagellar hook assembly protein FlgD